MLLNLDRDWVLRLHSSGERLYVGLLKTNSTKLDLMLAGVGKNFYPEDYSALLEVLSGRAMAEEKMSPHRKKRKLEGARQTFTNNCYFTTLQHVCADWKWLLQP